LPLFPERKIVAIASQTLKYFPRPFTLRSFVFLISLTSCLQLLLSIELFQGRKSLCSLSTIFHL
jgi:hypothetical protein